MGRWGQPGMAGGAVEGLCLWKASVAVCARQTWAPAPVPELHRHLLSVRGARIRAGPRSPPACRQPSPNPFNAASVPPCRAHW